ncbi:endonuclease [Candidatus Peregrinibacteria bacterium CG10_big_fil_rev_8_21_14_0_10_55_24]|nr:MAG: endonuclease [Candidatus Peregrinibacteria bacterium CG10_big_fil_rev_8_21_14_0_10_55_24]
MYFVYIIQSESDQTFYTGMTENLERRLQEHNAGIMKYSSAHKPWKLLYSEECTTREEARNREKYWKSGSGREEREAMLS